MKSSGLFPFRISPTLRILQTVGKTPWIRDQTIATALLTQDNKSIEEWGQTPMPRAGFEAMMPVCSGEET
jgi:hypothetical protein